MRERPTEVILNVTLALAALIFAAVLVRREVVGSPTSSPQALGTPTYVSGWETLLQPSRAIGKENALVRMIEFVDYECGFCQGFEQTRSMVAKEFPGHVAVSFLHFPIPSHRFARQAAVAAECARDVGRFAEMHDAIFRHQDSLGLKPWTEMAFDSGVQDTVRFRECLKSDVVSKRIDADIAIARKLSVNATPTLIVNGWKFPLPPDQLELRQIVDVLRANGVWKPTGGRDTVSLATVDKP